MVKAEVTMRKRTARLQAHASLGEPSLNALLADPVMLTLWRADRIDPDEARQLFSETRDRLQQCDGQRRRRRTKRERTSDDAYQVDGAFLMS
jgi:hypothetical protein